MGMRAFLVFFAISAVSGDAKPYTVAQVAAGLPVQNAVADGRLHNVGVITNAAQAGVKTVGALPLTYGGYPYVHYYGKREADPYTIHQVATGQTNGGVITGISYGNYGHGLLLPHHPYLHAYGKREAEPYTLGQVAAGLTAGGVVTGVDYGHGSGLVPATGVSYVHPAYAGYGYHLPYYG